MTHYRKKLIEVALPLDAIDAESAREKSIRLWPPIQAMECAAAAEPFYVRELDWTSRASRLYTSLSQ